MARKAKYLELEIAEMQKESSYKKRVEEYAFNKKVNDATQAEVIKMIFRREIKSTSCFYSGDDFSKSWDALIRQLANGKNNGNYETKLENLLVHIANISDTFFVEENNMKMMFSIIQMYDEFLRPIEKWIPKSRNRFKQAYELLRHLFAKYDVPEFLDKGFVKGELESISLFTIIGAGKSFKEFELAPKIVLNKKIYHHLFSTPEEYAFFEAFRRAQILSNGGSETLVYNILGSFLKNLQKDENFWFTVIQFFINQPMFDNNHVGPIVDYIQNKKYQTRVENGRILPPEQANFEIKGRTIQALIRQTEEWHQHLARTQARTSDKRQNVRQWLRFNLEDYDVTLTNKNRYQIIQYNTANDLAIEGRDMRHCVGSYAYSCSTGSKSIWSLRQIINEYSYKKILTLELDNRNMQLVQIRGKNNRRADDYEMSIVNLWAKKFGIGISRYCY